MKAVIKLKHPVAFKGKNYTTDIEVKGEDLKINSDFIIIENFYNDKKWYIPKHNILLISCEK